MNGIIPLYKEKGMTSHDCVMKIRKLFQTKKVGHTGTLDPDVEGTLPICIGRGTKIAEYMTLLPKEYEAEVTLGFSTETEDASGEVLEKTPVKENIQPMTIEKALSSFRGKQKQTPPMYSAVKIKGKRLYEYAREGLVVKRPVKDIEIYQISLLPNSLVRGEDTFSFRILVTCSKGTYIRTLSSDIGRALGFPAHMSDLKRTRSGPFQDGECYTLEELQQKKAAGQLKDVIVPLKEALRHLKHIEVGETTREKILHGRVLQEWEEIDESVFLFTYRKEALAIYQKHPDKPGKIKPKTMLQTI